MSHEEKKKIKFIRKWFKLEKERFTTIQILELLSRWIESCVSFEEYEMASALREERGYIMREYRNELHGKRGFTKSIILRFRYLLRKLRRKF